MPGTVKSELLPDADRSHKCDCQEKVSWKRNLPLDKSHFITEKEDIEEWLFSKKSACKLLEKCFEQLHRRKSDTGGYQQLSLFG